MHKNEILPISKVGFSIPWEDIECLCCVLGQYLIFFYNSTWKFGFNTRPWKLYCSNTASFFPLREHWDFETKQTNK